MENETHKTHDEKTNPQQQKKYPGYTPDPQSEIASDNFIEGKINLNDSDARLASKGPIRNPNYHVMVDQKKSDNDLDTVKKREANGKTLEDFNDTEPKRDSNKTIIISQVSK